MTEALKPRKFQRGGNFYRIMVNLPPDLAARVKEAANTQNMSLSYFCRTLIEEAMQRWETRQGGATS